MKSTLKILIFLFSLHQGFGQEFQFKQKLIDSIYVKALNNRFDLILSDGWTYIELNDLGKRLSKLNVSNRFKFLSKNELNKIAKKEKIYMIETYHKIINENTIDINFKFFSLSLIDGVISKNQITDKPKTYNPDMRFIKEESNWNIKINVFISFYD